VSVTPWANVYLNGKPAGETPFVRQLPAGRYRVRIENKDLQKEAEEIVIVSSEAPVTVKRTW
jgi:hypothetical protein